jgi:hypothetical protein
MNNGFINALNKEMLKMLDKETPFFLEEKPYYIENPFANPHKFIGKLFNISSQMLIHAHNQNIGHQFTQYAPINILTNKYLHWLENITPTNENFGTISSFKTDNGETRLQIIMPIKKLAQNEIIDDYIQQKPLANIIPSQNNKNTFSNIEDYFTTKLTNYFNAAFTHTFIKPEAFHQDCRTELKNSIQNDTAFVIRSATNAYKEIYTNQVTTMSHDQKENLKSSFKRAV